MPDSPPVPKRRAPPEAAVLALAEADALLAEALADALADAEALLALPEAALLEPPEEQPTSAAAMAADAPTPMKPLLVKFFIWSFPSLFLLAWVYGAHPLGLAPSPYTRHRMQVQDIIACTTAS